MYVTMYVYMYVCMYVCIYVCMYDIFRSNQWSTTGLSKAVVCTVLSMEKCI